MSNTKIAKILNKLLSDQNLKVSELARRIKVPQPTLHRIVSGSCANPHENSLTPIAKYFSISVDQLKGLEPFAQFDQISKVPLLTWEQAAQFPQKLAFKTDQHILTDVPVGAHSFALKVLDGAMAPFFPHETLLILDPAVTPKDKSYVIATVTNSDIPIFRQLIVNGSEKLLKPLSPDTNVYKIKKLNKNDRIIATTVQARWNYLTPQES